MFQCFYCFFFKLLSEKIIVIFPIEINSLVYGIDNFVPQKCTNNFELLSMKKLKAVWPYRTDALSTSLYSSLYQTSSLRKDNAWKEI